MLPRLMFDNKEDIDLEKVKSKMHITFMKMTNLTHGNYIAARECVP